MDCFPPFSSLNLWRELAYIEFLCFQQTSNHHELIALLTLPNSQLIFFSFFFLASLSCFFFSRRLSIELKPYIVIALSRTSQNMNRELTSLILVAEDIVHEASVLHLNQPPLYLRRQFQRHPSNERSARAYGLRPRKGVAYSITPRISLSFFSSSCCRTVTSILRFCYL